MTNKDDRADSTPGGRRGSLGHQREVADPIPMSRSEWKHIASQAYRALNDNNIIILAAGVSFFAVLALFPAISAFVALYSLFLDPQTVVQQLNEIKGVIPSDVLDLLINQMRKLATGPGLKLTITAILSLVVALWGTRTGTNALISALDVAYREHEERGLIQLNIFSLLLALAIILGLIAIVLLVIGIPFVFRWFGSHGWALLAGRALGIAAGAMVLVFGLAGIYRWVPDRRAPRWRWVTLGALVVMVFWILGSMLFSVYLGLSNHYSVTYGALGTIIILLVWMYITMLIMLVGGVLNAELEHQATGDTTVGAPQPPGERGAVVADNISSQSDSEKDSDSQNDNGTS